MKPTAKIAIVAAFVIAALVIVFIAKGSKGDKGDDGKKPTTDTKQTDKPKGTTEITFIYSTEKKDWVEASAAE